MATGRTSFECLPCISPQVLQVLRTLNLTHATPVQEATIPLLCGHKDVAVDACTGSGKTIAFLVPIFEKLRALEQTLKRHQVGAVIVSPTRELARQTFEVLQPFLSTVQPVEAALLVGGRDPVADAASLQSKGAGILVGTPGRLADIMERCSFLDFRLLEVLILDEADRLLDMGFRGHVDAIMSQLPKQRRTGLFSATQTDAVSHLARAGLRNPVRVNVAVTAAPQQAGNDIAEMNAKDGPHTSQAASQKGKQRTPASLQIAYMQCEPDQKLGHLIRFLQAHRQEKIIVYLLTCACVDFYAAVLPHLPVAHGLIFHALHGRMKQRARDAKLAAFKSSGSGCLLCTDVAARGLDIADIGWTVQVDAPQDPDAFVHRVGRSARMGRPGQALILLTPSEQAYVGFLQLRKIPLAEMEAFVEPPDVLPALRQAAESDRDVMDKGTRGFVSYVRAYKEHHCRFIFRLEELALGRLANTFGLLRLPRMPELSRAGPIKDFVPSPVDPESVKYKDKVRQKQWTRKQEVRAAAHLAHQGQGTQQSTGDEQQPLKQRKLPSAKRRQLEARQDEADFAAEYTMLKKLKRGKLSESDFDTALGLTQPIDDDAAENSREGQPKNKVHKHHRVGESGLARAQHLKHKARQVGKPQRRQQHKGARNTRFKIQKI